MPAGWDSPTSQLQAAAGLQELQWLQLVGTVLQMRTLGQDVGC
jgi:hypothetical protein